MKLKELEAILQQVNGFDNPKCKYEQYSTQWHLASRIIYTMESSFGDIHDKTIADLGCGCGMLSIGAACFNPNYICSFDIDFDAFTVFKNNINDLEIDELNCIDMVQTDIINDEVINGFYKSFDTVVMNPPFGTKNNKGIFNVLINYYY